MLKVSNGVYTPPDIMVGRHVFFAIENVDFNEDTPDGKRTFHDTATAIYQQSNPRDKEPELIIDNTGQSQRSLNDLPDSITSLLECPNLPDKPLGATYPKFGLFSEDELPIHVRKQDFAWLFRRTLSRSSSKATQVTVQQRNAGS